MKILAILASMLMATVSVVGLALADDTAQGKLGTAVRIFTPIGPGRRLQPAVVISSRVSGKCFAGSAASQGRPDAWRCMSGNAILDPCFEGIEQGRPILACARAPWSEQVVLLTLTDPLPRIDTKREAFPAALPWALELANGLRCTFLTGATSGVAGMRVNYGCDDGKTWIIGDVDRSLLKWRVFLLSADKVVAEQAGVTVAWY
jgi:hypothetical protein